MTSYDDFKKKAGETAEFVADKTVEFAKYAAEKAKLLGQIAKLKTDLTFERDNLKKSRVELGKAYYSKFGHDPEDDMADTCAKVGASLDLIAAKKREIETLKAMLKEKPFSCDDEDIPEADTEEADDKE